MKRSENDFKEDLFDSMEAWLPDRDDNIPEHEVLMPNTSSVYDKYGSIATRTDQGTTFSLKKGTAPLLAATIAQIFKEVRKILTDPNVNQSQAAFHLVDPFVWLHAVLANRHVEALLTETSLRFALVPKWTESTCVSFL